MAEAWADDVGLVEHCRAGHALAMRELVARFQGDVYGVCYRMLNHSQDAEDVLQETFVRVFRSLATWDPTRALKPWILGIAINRCKTMLATRSRRPASVEYIDNLPAKTKADDSAELMTEIQAALAKMRPEFQAVFMMFHEQGCSYDEIAATHNRPVGTIKTWLHRCREEVLRHLKRKGMAPGQEE